MGAISNDIVSGVESFLPSKGKTAIYIAIRECESVRDDQGKKGCGVKDVDRTELR